MSANVASVSLSVSLMDALLFGTIILFAFYGFKQGVLRALFGFFCVYFSFIITTLFHERLAALLQMTFSMSTPLALTISFTAVFAILLFVVWLAWRILRRMLDLPETSSYLSKIGGTILGIAGGVLITSVIIMAINLYPLPETQSPLRGTIFYKTIKQIAPAIRDFTIGHAPRLKTDSDKSKLDDF